MRHSRRVFTDPCKTAQVAVLGDFYLGDWYMRWREDRGRSNVLLQRGIDHCFSSFRKFLESCDFTIANLEATLTRNVQSPFAGRKDYILDASPELTLDAMRRYRMGGVTLGNNHAVDFGAERVSKSLRHLTEAGILSCGAGENAVDAADPLVLEMVAGSYHRSLVVFSAYAYNRDYDQNYRYYASAHSGGVCPIGDNFFSSIERWRQRNPDALILCCPHWGKNYAWRSETQMALADRILAAGANLILGHGSHMMQEIERRADRWVVYSLGNFIFNSHGEYDRHSLPPFSLASKLIFSLEHEKLPARLLLYPFYCDNVKTNWQPRWVNTDEFGEISYRLINHLGPDHFITAGQDQYGYFIELKID
jgi:hypothetical protein